MNNKHLDYIIVGQGIAGSTLAYKLLMQDKRIIIIDSDKKITSSKIAAGLINPITGRRIVKTWLWDQIYPSAKKYYEEVSSYFETPLWKNILIEKSIETIDEQNQLDLRMGMEDYKKLISLGDKKYFITEAARVDIENYLHIIKEFCQLKSSYLKETFNYNEVILNADDSIDYKEYTADKIIFCEGIKSMENPYFNYLPFNPDKGERLILKSESYTIEQIQKKKMAIIPMNDGAIWVGATNSFDYIDENPTQIAKQNILADINSLITNYIILAHDSAIRPTVKDRRPIIGSHPKYRNMFIFNGFGTKGASLIPFFADLLINHIDFSAGLISEIDIERFFFEK